jgi:ParB family chromosome partitioning protein
MPEVQRKRKSRLGRGLTSLIGDPVEVDVPGSDTPGADTPSSDTQPEQSAITSPTQGRPQTKNQTETNLIELAPDAIHPSPFQPRKSFDDGDLDQLAESIRRAGMMQPVVVRPGASGDYELIAGERRWRAAKKIGLERMPAVVRDLPDEDAAELAIIENVQRKDLSAMERAWGFRTLADRFGLSHAQVAERVGLERSSVTNLVRLTELEQSIQDLLHTGAIGSGHGKALLALEAGAERERIAKQAADEGWSVRRLEQQAQEPRPARGTNGQASDGDGGGESIDPGRADLEKQLAEHLGTKVAVKTNGSGTKGKLVIEFYSLDHFDGLMSRLGFEMR